MAARKPSAPKTDATAVALARLSEQVAAMGRQLEDLTALVRAQGSAAVAASELEANGAATVMNPNPFAPVLLLTLAELDHGDERVAIADVRKAFVERGWTRAELDARLLEAERASIVDLRPSDPAPADLEAALVDPVRGPLHYVVVR